MQKGYCSVQNTLSGQREWNVPLVRLGPTLVTRDGQPSGLGEGLGLPLHSNVFTYLVYRVLKGFFLGVGLGKRVSMMLCELHSPIPPPLESRFINKHSDCNKHGEHNYCDHDWYNIRALTGGT